MSELARWDVSQPVLLTHAVEAADVGERITRVAGAAFEALGSKSQGERAIKCGALTLNGEGVEKSRCVKLGDLLTYQPLASQPRSAAALEALARFVVHLRTAYQGLDVAYEDDVMAVVFKPPGVHTKSKSNPKYAAFEDALPAVLYPPPPSHGDSLPWPLAVHRLDVPVSGLTVVAKTRAAMRGLTDQFTTRRVQKEYRALCVGDPRGPGAEAGSLRSIMTSVDGAEAETLLEVLSVTPHPQWGALAHVSLRPLTGRTHQLRVHCASLGCPIVGDELYWEAGAAARRARGAAELPPLKLGSGLYLVSVGVRLEHPAEDGRRVEASAAEPPKFAQLRERARSGAEYASAKAGSG